MGIKFNEKTRAWEAVYYKRHPITRVPMRSVRVGIKSEAEAKRVFAELVVTVENRLQDSAVPRWQSFLDQFEIRAREPNSTLSEKTLRDMMFTLRAHTKGWATKPIDKITGEDMRSVVLGLAKTVSVGHQKNMLKYFRAVFRYALDRGILSRDPCPVMKFKMGDKIKGVLTVPQATMLLNKAKEYDWAWYPHVTMALYTGMRNGELYALTWDKVDLDNRTILVDASWNKVVGTKETKSEDDRMVEIAPTLLTVLQELRLRAGDSPYVLPRLARWTMGLQASDLRMFLTALNLPVVRFHDLRATWATIMLGMGIEPAKVMVMGGWKDMKTMMIYMRKAGIEIRGITNRLNLHNPSRVTAPVFELNRSHS